MTTEKKVVKKKKKILVKRTKSQKMIRKYGGFLIIFFLSSMIYFTWLYGVPALLNAHITQKKVNNFLEKRIGFKVDYKDAKFYTTNSVDFGVRFKDLKLYYPGSSTINDKGLFLQSRLAIFEIPAIPLAMKTIRFKEFVFRTTKINLYQDETGKYFYLQNIKKNFNPQMPKYILEVPTIEIYAYNILNYNKKTGSFQKKRDSEMIIRPEQSKEVLREAPKSNTIMLR
ncbi:MAG: hypothetical protein K6C94_04320 [Candidatus Gastranaerophilales bacterium]|nr:hypothetical protein [Candidatus Gastranaerophilales bacterium]